MEYWEKGKVDLPKEVEECLIKHGLYVQLFEKPPYIEENNNMVAEYAMLHHWFKRDSYGQWWIISEEDLPPGFYEDTDKYRIKQLKEEIEELKTKKTSFLKRLFK